MRGSKSWQRGTKGDFFGKHETVGILKISPGPSFPKRGSDNAPVKERGGL
jgi:hypothetical protein